MGQYRGGMRAAELDGLTEAMLTRRSSPDADGDWEV